MAKLRDILLENNILFPATAKKKHLIELFEKHIVAKKGKRKHLKKSAKTKNIESSPTLDEEPTNTPEKKKRTKKEAKDTKLQPKGNVFEVDSDSESDILSPRKKPKISPRSTPLKILTQDSSIKTETSENSSDEKEDTIENNENEINSSTSHKPVVVPFSPAGSSDSSSVSHASFSEKSASVQHQESSSRSPSQSEISQNSSIDLFADTAQSFDKSLTAIKQRHSGGRNTSRDDRDVELAKLLGVDIGGVKPKKKGRRVTTPRRPIIIQEKRLSRDYYNLSNDEIDLASKIEPKEEDDIVLKKMEELNQEILSEENENEVLTTEEELKTSVTEEQRTRHTNHVVSLHVALRGVAYLVAWLTLLGVTLFGYWYREQTFLVGYCGQEIIKPTIPATPETPELLVAFGEYLDQEFRPKCVKCPQHARCFPNLEIACYDDFVEYTPWYFSYMPIVDPTLKRCVPNTKKAEKIEIMIDVALDLLRARNANRNCGNTPVDDLESGVSIQDLHDLLLSIKAAYITEEEFEELWARSVVELEGKPEIIVRQVTV